MSKNTLWIVQENLNQADRVLCFIFEEHNILNEFIKIVPFSEEVPNVNVPLNTSVIVRGSTTMMIGAKKQNWVPGVWHNDNFKPSVYKRSFQQNFLNHKGTHCNIDKIQEQFEQYDSERLFIRANSDYKELSGEVYTKEEAKELVTKIKNDSYYFGNDLEVFLSPIVDIKEEYRLIVVNGMVVSGFSYKINGVAINIPAPQNVIDFGQNLAHLGPDLVYCLDIGRTSDNDLGVIECNCFNGSGLYGDHENIILSIDSLVKKYYK